MNIERIIELAATVRLEMEALQRRVQCKPGHQGVTAQMLLTAARDNLDRIEEELAPELMSEAELRALVARD
jgi:hypothetical protein